MLPPPDLVSGIGTLVPIAADPTTPQLDPGAADTPRALAKQDALVTRILSGRAIEDLYTRIRLEGQIYAGNQFRFVEPGAAARREALEQICEELASELRPLSGTIVEYKGRLPACTTGWRPSIC